MAVEVCPSHPVVPAGYTDWSKPRLVRRIAELEKVSGEPLRALPSPNPADARGAGPRKWAEGALLPGHKGGRLCPGTATHGMSWPEETLRV